MEYIDAQTVIIFNTADIVLAMADSEVNYIYFGSNIQLEYGVSITPNRTVLTIDGAGYQFTDMNSIFNTDTLGLRAASNLNLTIKNLTIVGQNYYGVPYVAELSGLAGARVTYENVTYSGPQMVFHPYGITRFFNCDITITYAPDQSRAQEVGEVCKLEFEGRVNIDHRDTNDAVFWFRGNRNDAYLHVLPGAEVTINSNSYLMFAAFYNVIFYDPLPVAYEIQTGASLTVHTATGISLNSTHQAASFLIDSNASFIFTQLRAAEGGHTVFLNGNFTVNQDAHVYMQADFQRTGALVRFTTANTNLNLSTPKSCVFYNSGAAALSFTQSINFSFGCGQLNQWQTATALATAGSFSDIPHQKWNKNQYAPLTCSGTAASTGTTVTNHNFTDAELENLPLLQTLQLQTARVLSAGDVRLILNPVVDDQTPINGQSEPNANIRVQYTLESSQTLFDTADADGAFSVNTPEALPINTVVTVAANTPFLIVEQTGTVRAAGALTLLAAPDMIRFLLTPVSLSPLMLARESPDATVEVYDTRIYSTAWQLVASVPAPLITPSGDTLPDAVVFLDDNEFFPLGETPLTVFSGAASDGTPTTTRCSWQSNRGILLHVTKPIAVNERYTANLLWDVLPIQ